MRIGLISDTHGVVPAWAKAMEALGDVDMILHAGDLLYHSAQDGVHPGYDIPELARLINSSGVPIVIARGNCDAEVYEELLEVPVLSPYAYVVAEGVRIVVTHGQNLSEQQMERTAAKYHASIIVSGHTHLPVIEQLGPALHVNPGSPAHPKLVVENVPTPTVGLIGDGMIRVLDLNSGKAIASEPFPTFG